MIAFLTMLNLPIQTHGSFLIFFIYVHFLECLSAVLSSFQIISFAFLELNVFSLSYSFDAIMSARVFLNFLFILFVANG